MLHGNGTTLQCVIDNIENKNLDAKINLVVSDNPNAHALERAKAANIPTYIIQNSNNNEVDLELLDVLSNYNVDLIVLVRILKINWS